MSQSASRLAEHLIHLSRAGCAAGEGDALTPAQWAALRFVASANRRSATPGAFARFHGVTKGTASQTVRALIRKGLVEAEPGAGDARSRMLTATPAGRAKLGDDPIAPLVCAIDAMEPHERRDFERALGALAGRLHTVSAHRSVFGVCAACRNLERGSDGPPQCRAYDEPVAPEQAERFCEAFDPHPGGRSDP